MKKKQKARKPSTGSKRTPSSKASIASTVSRSKWIRIDRPFSLPVYVKQVVERLDEAGHVAFVVGGSVRDFLLNRPTKDHDIATSASPDELCRLFPDAITVGKAYGVIKIPIHDPQPSGAQLLEVATFREDVEYLDHRHPKKIRFASPDEDAARRDFTINALYYDPKTSRLLDPVEGLPDLKAGIIRAIGLPTLRFKEDALRLLRGIRFTASLNFSLEPATAAAIKEKARLITHVSAERIRDELTLILTGPRPALALELLSKSDLLRHVLPEIAAMKGVEQSPVHHPEGDVWMHTLRCVDFLSAQNPKRSATLAWGTLLHDVGKPLAGRRNNGLNFNGHELDGAKIAETITQRLKMSSQETDRIRQLVLEHMKFKDVFAMRESTLERFIRQPYFPELLALHKADSAASDGNLAYHEFCESRLNQFKASGETLNSPKLVDGKDLIQLGLKPGPGFSEILRTIEDLALEKKLQSKEQALEYVVKHFVK